MSLVREQQGHFHVVDVLAKDCSTILTPEGCQGASRKLVLYQRENMFLHNHRVETQFHYILFPCSEQSLGKGVNLPQSS